MAWIRLPTRNNPLSSFLNLLNYQSSHPPKTITMAVCQSNSKRPTCPSCSKPYRLCLCTRIQNPGLDNKVSVTVLQHSLERKHPLNSVRIAKLGLRNVNVVTVSDVNFDASFIIRLLESNSGGWESLNLDGVLDRKENQKRKIEDIDGSCSVAVNMGKGYSDEEPVIFATIGKCGEMNELESIWKWKPQVHPQENSNFDQILASKGAINDLEKGFIVKKLQRKQSNGSSTDMEEYEEFELVIPSGSVLLFPSEKAVGVDELLQEMNIGVKNLIVLDGTWAKAKRMYMENPWLRILPHLKLNLDKLSLYSEVRSQPKAGCLSSIESIVYALKAVGDNPEGLDSLLDVFESMVGDQRRCKDERLRKEHVI
ncbi:uncharacterized protein LOC105632938 [Jatropha curcas]|uniref:uncharacterized protein LOC105632938 n=1 Tax=Jatropha curcas TaxID=180498 RepID=UPI0005FB0F6B|nr:uncharacterized protein LOC105632938 [Jatropha curcas]